MTMNRIAKHFPPQVDAFRTYGAMQLQRGFDQWREYERERQAVELGRAIQDGYEIGLRDSEPKSVVWALAIGAVSGFVVGFLLAWGLFG